MGGKNGVLRTIEDRLNLTSPNITMDELEGSRTIKDSNGHDGHRVCWGWYDGSVMWVNVNDLKFLSDAQKDIRTLLDEVRRLQEQVYQYEQKGDL